MLVVLGMLLVQSCSTVKGTLHNPEFVQKNHPIRTLDVLVLSDGSYEKAEIEQFIQESSKLLEEQVGVNLRITSHIPVQWSNREIPYMLSTVKNTTDGTQFDMAVAFTKRTPGEFVMRNVLGVDWDGCIDDTWRRYVILKALDKHALLHEVAHAFVLNQTHAAHGLLAPMTVQLLPLVPLKIESLYLTAEDRNDFLRNKWRSFSERAELDEREHPISN
jgi:hypothetical protein